MSFSDAARRFEPALIVLIAVHSYAVGIFLLFLTRWGAAFGGWGEASPLFFPRQAGIFHVVVATGYVIEYFRYRGVSFLIMAKASAVVFLGAIFILDRGPWAVPLSALADGLMAAVVVTVHRAAARGHRQHG